MAVPTIRILSALPVRSARVPRVPGRPLCSIGVLLGLWPGYALSAGRACALGFDSGIARILLVLSVARYLNLKPYIHRKLASVTPPINENRPKSTFSEHLLTSRNNTFSIFSTSMCIRIHGNQSWTSLIPFWAILNCSTHLRINSAVSSKSWVTPPLLINFKSSRSDM